MTSATPILDGRERQAWRGFLRTHARLIAALDDDLQRRHGLPLTAFEVLLYLDRAPDRRLRMAEVAASVLLSPSGITRLVDRLVAEGLVEKVPCASDRRGSYAVLTERGAQRFAAAEATHLAGVRTRFLDHLSPAQLAALGSCWEALEADQ